MALARIKRNRFLVLGRAGMDLYADPPGTRIEDALHFSAALGGSAANIAVAITKLGGTASIVTAVSDDAVGRYTVKQLRHYGVGAEHVRAVSGEARNSLAVVETRNENCQSVIYRNGAADLHIGSNDVQNIAYADFGALIIAGTCLAGDPSRTTSFLAIKLARKAGLPVILDIDYRPYSWVSTEDAADTCTRAAALSDIVVGNDVEFAVMAGGGDGLALARRLSNSTAKIAVYKMGEKGSVTFSDGQSSVCGVYSVTALKPTGAGDAFMAGFVTGLAADLDVPACAWRGSAAAAIVVTRPGCAPAMPTASELDNFIAGHPKPV